MNKFLLKKTMMAIMTAAMAVSAVSVPTIMTSAGDRTASLAGIRILADTRAEATQASGFYVDGTTIRDANGNEFIMRGVNIAHAWYKDKTETSIKAAAALGCNTVRVVCANGVQWDKTTADELKNIINICKENQQVCILEVHDATGSDNAADIMKAAEYWIEMKDILNENSKYVILNIANEWFGSWDSAGWADGCASAIKAVRNAGIKNMIMIDSAGWGQYPDSIKNNGKSVFDADPDKNTVFSIHLYEYAGGNAEMVKTNIDNCLSIGVPVVVGEFGGQHTDGDVDEATIMSYCTEKGAGYLGWSWKGNNPELAYLDVALEWDGSRLTEWGEALINGPFGIKNTSKTCSIYSGAQPSETPTEKPAETPTEAPTEKPTDAPTQQPSATQTSGFYVDGTTIRDANGNEFIMRGVNIAHAWYRDKTETSIKAAAALGCNTVRVVCADGVQWSKTTAEEIKDIIRICKENQQICILEVHDATGSDNAADIMKAAEYWIEMKDILNENSKYVILNIANEWFGSWDSAGWADGCASAIKAVRNAGIKNMIMIDSAGWGQYPDSVKNNGKSVFDADPDKNTVFSIHLYEYAGGNAEMVKTNIDNCLSIGIPLVVGEFGGQHTDGDVDEATIMSYCTEKRAGYLGWSWKGNNPELAYLDVALEWDGSRLTEWGEALINGPFGIKNTSEICSVYTGKPSQQPSETTPPSEQPTEQPTETTPPSQGSTTEKDAAYTELLNDEGNTFWKFDTTGGTKLTITMKTNSNDTMANGVFNPQDAKDYWEPQDWSASADGTYTVTYDIPSGHTFVDFYVWYPSSSTLVSAVLTLAEASQQPTGTPTETTAPTEAVDSTVKYGDVNEDGKVNLLDVVLLNKHLMTGSDLPEQGRKNADVDRDGTLSAVDSLNILKNAIDLTELPV